MKNLTKVLFLSVFLSQTISAKDRVLPPPPIKPIVPKIKTHDLISFKNFHRSYIWKRISQEEISLTPKDLLERTIILNDLSKQIQFIEVYPAENINYQTSSNGIVRSATIKIPSRIEYEYFEISKNSLKIFDYNKKLLFTFGFKPSDNKIASLTDLKTKQIYEPLKDDQSSLGAPAPMILK